MNRRKIEGRTWRENGRMYEPDWLPLSAHRVIYASPGMRHISTPKIISENLQLRACRCATLHNKELRCLQLQTAFESVVQRDRPQIQTRAAKLASITYPRRSLLNEHRTSGGAAQSDQPAFTIKNGPSLPRIVRNCGCDAMQSRY